MYVMNSLGIEDAVTYMNAFIIKYIKLTYQSLLVTLKQLWLLISWLIPYAVIRCLAVFAKLNKLKNGTKQHKMLNTATRLSIQYTRTFKWICDHEYSNTVTQLINTSYVFVLTKKKIGMNLTTPTTISSRFLIEAILPLFSIHSQGDLVDKTIWCYRTKVSLRQAQFITFTNHMSALSFNIF